jgi:hypothetical protein
MREAPLMQPRSSPVSGDHLEKMIERDDYDRKSGGKNKPGAPGFFV